MPRSQDTLSPVFKFKFSLSLCIFLYLYILCILSIYIIHIYTYCCTGFSLVEASGGYSLIVMSRPLTVVASLVAEHRLWSVWASVAIAHGLSHCASQAPSHRLNSCGAWALVALRHGGSSPIRGQTRVSCIGKWIPYHWATREAPILPLF